MSIEPIEPLDSKLQALFEREHAHLPDEPFVNALVRRLAVERRRRALATRVLQAGGLVAVVPLSPWLVAGSRVLSENLDATFERTAAWLATPAGWVTLLICGFAAVVAVLWRRPSIR